ncbi:MAG: RIP metalloprotease RseP [Syntrophobacterales bacterium]|nr:RIP metalloprotease RseP [Syntrophobacterales bacterium]
MMVTIISAVVVIGLLILVHELGHFFVAKKTGVRVERFSIGFGPVLFSLKRGETEYCLSAIPFGGYVKMLGEGKVDEVSPSDYHRSFAHKPLWVRMAIVAAGPLANVMLALVSFWFVYGVAGVPYLTPEIGEVSPGSPAERAGIRKGDVIVRIDGKTVKSWNDVSSRIQSWREDQEPIELIVQRGEELIALKVIPRVQETQNLFGEKIIRPMIGVVASGKVNIEKVGLLKGIVKSVEQVVNITQLFFVTLAKLIQGILPFNTLGGPVLIAQMAGQQAQAGLFPFINFTAVLSLNLAVINLLPFPALDGGHLLIFFIEAITRRRIHEKLLERIQQIGFALLIVLMVAVLYNDIVRIFPWIPEMFRFSGASPK